MISNFKIKINIMNLNKSVDILNVFILAMVTVYHTRTTHKNFGMMAKHILPKKRGLLRIGMFLFRYK